MQRFSPTQQEFCGQDHKVIRMTHCWRRCVTSFTSNKQGTHKEEKTQPNSCKQNKEELSLSKLKMRLSTVLLLLFITAIVLVDLSEAARGRGRGGSRGRGRSRSRSSSRSRSTPTHKITKYTPIKAITVRSPVIVSQTKIGSRSSAYKKVLVGYVVYRYALSYAPVYRSGYPMYRSYLTIPDKRAVRVTYEEESLVNDGGQRCLADSSTQQTLREGIDRNLVELNTTVKYKKTGETKKYYGDIISLEDINEQDFEVTTRARYNTTIVEGRSCTQVEKKVQGTMITLYETNPNYVNPRSYPSSLHTTPITAYNKGSSLYISNELLATVITLTFGIVHVSLVAYL